MEACAQTQIQPAQAAPQLKSHNPTLPSGAAAAAVSTGSAPYGVLQLCWQHALATGLSAHLGTALGEISVYV